jgi:RHS repeat-associated protein
VRRGPSIHLTPQLVDGLEKRQLLTSTGTLIDINTLAAGSVPTYVSWTGRQDVVVDGKSYFAATNPQSGTELWVTDGTAAGTRLAANIADGAASSTPWYLTKFGDKVIFNASGPNSATGLPTGTEVWIYDPAAGTDGQARLVKDINPYQWGTDPWGFTDNGSGKAFFTIYSGAQLWMTDGTEAGTTVVKDSTGADVTNPTQWQPMAVVNGVVYFGRTTTADGSELWKTDGTQAGTVRVTNINPGAGNAAPASLYADGNYVYFSATSATGGAEPYRLDTTTGVVTNLADVNAGAGSSSPGNFVRSGNKVFFIADNGSSGRELYAYDLSSGAVQLVKDVASGSVGGLSEQSARMVDVNGTLFFFGYDASNGLELWKSDGTTAGTTIVRNLAPGGQWSPLRYNDQQLIVVGSNVYFSATNGSTGVELFKSDGTNAGTVLAWEGRAGAAGSNPINLRLVGDKVVFNADNGVTGMELWSVDAQGVATNVDITGPDATQPSNPNNLRRIGNDLFFWADNGVVGREPYKSDGTPSGTSLLRDILAGASSSNGSGSPLVEAATGKYIFGAYGSGSNGYELWVSDGTNAGTTLLKDIWTGGSGSAPTQFTKLGTSVFFTANDGSTGVELWKTDGTAAGTTRVADIAAGSTSSDPQSLIVFNGKLYFTATTSSSGRELWVSDGTSAGTTQVADIESGGTGSSPAQLTVSGSTLHFVATTAAYGSEIWSLPAGSSTPIVDDLTPGATGSNPLYLVDAAGTLYFNGKNNQYYWGSLFAKTGTSGAQLTTNTIGVPERLTAVGSTVYFMGLGSTGYELYKFDGTTSSLVKDIAPGSAHSLPGNMYATNGKLYFTATNADSGTELWVTDGTTAGTELVADVNAGSGTSDPAELTRFGDRLLFTADDGTHGRELWSVSLRGFAPWVVDDGTLGATAMSPTSIRVRNLTDIATVNIASTVLAWSSDGGVTWPANQRRVVQGFNGTETITGLQPNRTYHIKIFGDTGEGPTVGAYYIQKTLDVGGVLRIDGTTSADVIALSAVHAGDEMPSGLIANESNVRFSLGGGSQQKFLTSAVTSIVVNGFAGNDIIDLSAMKSTSPPTIVFAGDGSDTVLGGPGNDILDGGIGNDSLLGNDGNDTIYGQGGNDTLDGGAGNDALYGYAGNDVLRTDDAGELDTLLGGSGTDYAQADGNDAIVATDVDLALRLSGGFTAQAGEEYHLKLNILRGVGGSLPTIQSWTVRWGDGTQETIPLVAGSPSVLERSHIYSASSPLAVSIDASMSFGTWSFDAPSLGLDRSLDRDGRVTHQYSGSWQQNVIPLRDGTYMVQVDDSKIYRYEANGRPRPSWGGNDGFVTIPTFDPLPPPVTEPASQSSSYYTPVTETRVIGANFGGFYAVRGVALVDEDAGSESYFVEVRRYTAEGLPDPAFNGSKPRRIQVDSFDNFDPRPQLDVDGGVILAMPTGAYDVALLLARIKPDGSIDSGFSLQSNWGTTNYEYVTDYRVQTDGRIVVLKSRMAGSNWANPVMSAKLERYLPNGSLDASFGTGGVVTAASVDFGQWGSGSLALQPDGKIVVFSRPGSMAAVLAARFTSTGAVDSTFGNAGQIAAAEQLPYGRYRGVLVDGAGRITIVDSTVGGGYVMKFLKPDGAADLSRGRAGTLTLNSWSIDGAWLDRDGRTVIAARANNGSDDAVVVSRLNAVRIATVASPGDVRVTQISRTSTRIQWTDRASPGDVVIVMRRAAEADPNLASSWTAVGTISSLVGKIDDATGLSIGSAYVYQLYTVQAGTGLESSRVIASHTMGNLLSLNVTGTESVRIGVPATFGVTIDNAGGGAVLEPSFSWVARRGATTLFTQSRGAPTISQTFDAVGPVELVVTATLKIGETNYTVSATRNLTVSGGEIGSASITGPTTLQRGASGVFTATVEVPSGRRVGYEWSAYALSGPNESTRTLLDLNANPSRRDLSTFRLKVPAEFSGAAIEVAVVATEGESRVGSTFRVAVSTAATLTSARNRIDGIANRPAPFRKIERSTEFTGESKDAIRNDDELYSGQIVTRDGKPVFIGGGSVKETYPGEKPATDNKQLSWYSAAVAAPDDGSAYLVRELNVSGTSGWSTNTSTLTIRDPFAATEPQQGEYQRRYAQITDVAQAIGSDGALWRVGVEKKVWSLTGASSDAKRGSTPRIIIERSAGGTPKYLAIEYSSHSGLETDELAVSAAPARLAIDADGNVYYTATYRTTVRGLGTTKTVYEVGRVEFVDNAIRVAERQQIVAAVQTNVTGTYHAGFSADGLSDTEPLNPLEVGKLDEMRERLLRRRDLGEVRAIDASDPDYIYLTGVTRRDVLINNTWHPNGGVIVLRLKKKDATGSRQLRFDDSLGSVPANVPTGESAPQITTQHFDVIGTADGLPTGAFASVLLIDPFSNGGTLDVGGRSPASNAIHVSENTITIAGEFRKGVGTRYVTAPGVIQLRTTDKNASTWTLDESFGAPYINDASRRSGMFVASNIPGLTREYGGSGIDTSANYLETSSRSMVVRDDGSIALAVNWRDTVDGKPLRQMAILRLTGDGRPDTSLDAIANVEPDVFVHEDAETLDGVIRIKSEKPVGANGPSLDYAYGLVSDGSSYYLFGTTEENRPRYRPTDVDPNDRGTDWYIARITEERLDARDLRGSVQADGSVLLEWIDSAVNEEGFLVERRRQVTTPADPDASAEGSWAVVGYAGANARQFVDAAVRDAVTYEYRVTAFKGNKSDVSPAEVTVITPPRDVTWVPLEKLQWTIDELKTTGTTWFDAAKKMTDSVLQAGETYMVRASGWFSLNNAAGIEGDPAFGLWAPDAAYNSRMGSRPVRFGVSMDELRSDGTVKSGLLTSDYAAMQSRYPVWGQPSRDHVYTTFVTGTGAKMNLQYWDSVYGDNDAVPNSQLPPMQVEIFRMAVSRPANLEASFRPASGSTAEHVKLAWRHAARRTDDGYEIERRIDDGEWQFLARVDANPGSPMQSYDDFDLAGFEKQRLHYRARSIRGFETSKWSNEISVVKNNLAPTWPGQYDSPIPVAAGVALSLPLTAVDPDGNSDAVKFRLVSAPGNLFIDSANRLAGWTPRVGDPDVIVHVVATDEGGASTDAKSLTLRVDAEGVTANEYIAFERAPYITEPRGDTPIDAFIIKASARVINLPPPNEPQPEIRYTYTLASESSTVDRDVDVIDGADGSVIGTIRPTPNGGFTTTQAAIMVKHARLGIYKFTVSAALFVNGQQQGGDIRIKVPTAAVFARPVSARLVPLGATGLSEVSTDENEGTPIAPSYWVPFEVRATDQFGNPIPSSDLYVNGWLQRSEDPFVSSAESPDKKSFVRGRPGGIEIATIRKPDDGSIRLGVEVGSLKSWAKPIGLSTYFFRSTGSALAPLSAVATVKLDAREWANAKFIAIDPVAFDQAGNNLSNRLYFFGWERRRKESAAGEYSGSPDPDYGAIMSQFPGRASDVSQAGYYEFRPLVSNSPQGTPVTRPVRMEGTTPILRDEVHVPQRFTYPDVRVNGAYSASNVVNLEKNADYTLQVGWIDQFYHPISLGQPGAPSFDGTWTLNGTPGTLSAGGPSGSSVSASASAVVTYHSANADYAGGFVFRESGGAHRRAWFSIRVGNVPNEPTTAAIVSPGDPARPVVVRHDMPIEIYVGDEDSALSTSWTLELARLNDAGDVIASSWREIGKGNGTIGSSVESGGVGAMLRATNLPDGKYRIRLTATDDVNNPNRTVVDVRDVQIAADLKLGNFILPQIDYQADLPGQEPFVIQRIYDSLDATKPSTVGMGWRLSYSDIKYRNTEDRSSRWNSGTAARTGDLLSVDLPGRGQRSFAFVPQQNIASLAGATSKPRWVSLDNSGARVEFDTDVLIQLTEGEWSVYSAPAGSGLSAASAYNSKRSGQSLKIIETDGTVFSIDPSSGRLQSMTNSFGETTTYSANPFEPITLPDGRQIRFTQEPSTSLIRTISIAPTAQAVFEAERPLVEYGYEAESGAQGAPRRLVTVDNHVTQQHTQYTYGVGTKWALLMGVSTKKLGTTVSVPAQKQLGVTYTEDETVYSIEDADGNETVLEEASWDGTFRVERVRDSQDQITEVISRDQRNPKGGEHLEGYQTTRIVKQLSYRAGANPGPITVNATVELYGYDSKYEMAVKIGDTIQDKLVSVLQYRPYTVYSRNAAVLLDPSSLSTPAHGQTFQVFDGADPNSVPRADWFQLSSDVTYDASGNATATTYGKYKLGQPGLVVDDAGNASRVYVSEYGVPADDNYVRTVTTSSSLDRTASVQKFDNRGRLTQSTTYENAVIAASGALDMDNCTTVSSSSYTYRTTTSSDIESVITTQPGVAPSVSLTQYDDKGRVTLSATLGAPVSAGQQRVWSLSKPIYEGNSDRVLSTRSDDFEDDGDAVWEPSVDTVPGDARDGISSYTKVDDLGRSYASFNEYALVSLNQSVPNFGSLSDSNATLSRFDTRGQVVRTLYPDNTESLTVYDAKGRAVWTTDRFVSAANRESFDAQRQRIVAAPLATNTLYDDQGRQTVTRRVANASFRITRTQVGASTTLHTYAVTLNAQGSELSRSVTQYDDDNDGCVKQTISPGGLISTPIYNARNEQTGTVDNLGQQSDSATRDVFVLSPRDAGTTVYAVTLSYTDAAGVKRSKSVSGNSAQLYDKFDRAGETGTPGNGDGVGAVDEFHPLARAASAPHVFDPNNPFTHFHVEQLLGSLRLTSLIDNRTYAISITRTDGPNQVAVPQNASEHIAWYRTVAQRSGVVTQRAGNAPTGTPTQWRDTLSESDSKGRPTLTRYADGSFTQTLHFDYAERNDIASRTGLTLPVAKIGGQNVTLNDVLANTQLDAEPIATRRVEVALAQRTTAVASAATWRVYSGTGKLLAVFLPAVVDASPGAGTASNPLYTYRYDTAGRQTHEIDPRGNAIRFSYDALGRRTQRELLGQLDGAGATPADDASESWIYDDRGRVESHVDFMGRTAVSIYDDSTVVAAGRLVEQRFFAAGVTPDATKSNWLVRVETLYDNSGDARIPVELRSSLGRVVGIVETSREPLPGGHGASAANPVTRTTLYRYDPITGQRSSIATPEGTVEYDYDPKTGQQTATRAFGPGSNPSIDSTATTASSTKYDAAGRTIELTQDRRGGQTVADRVTHRYGFAGELLYTLYQRPGDDLRHDFAYDALGRAVATFVSVDDGDAIRGVSFNPATGVVTRLDPDERQVSSQQHVLRIDGQRTGSIEKTYKPDGSLFSSRTITWGYDALNRLTSETIDHTAGSGVDSSETFGYDLVGNRVTNSRTQSGSTVTTSSSYNARDWLTSQSVGGSVTTFTYNADGSLASRGAEKHAYDVRGRLVFVDHDGDGQVDADDVRLRSDENGTRIWRQVGTSTPQVFLMDVQSPTGYVQPVEVHNAPAVGTASIAEAYLLGQDVYAQTLMDGAVPTAGHALLYDTHGNVTGTYGAAGLTESYSYTAFGTPDAFVQVSTNAPVTQANAKTHLQYAGEWWDSGLGMQWLRARYYDPQLGRFSSFDSYEGDGSEPLTLHKFVYGHNSPVYFTDPTGMFSLGEMMFTSAINGSKLASRGLTVARVQRQMRTAREVISFFSKFMRGADRAHDLLASVSNMLDLLRFDPKDLLDLRTAIEGGVGKVGYGISTPVLRIPLPTAMGNLVKRLGVWAEGELSEWIGSVFASIALDALRFEPASLKMSNTGLDGIYRHRDTRAFMIVEAKGGKSKLSKGTPNQMSDEWIYKSLRTIVDANIKDAKGAQEASYIRSYAGTDKRLTAVDRPMMAMVVKLDFYLKQPTILIQVQTTPGASWKSPL